MKALGSVAVWCLVAALMLHADANSVGYQGQHFVADLATDDCVVLFTVPQPAAARQAMRAVKVMTLADEPEAQAMWQSLSKLLEKSLAGPTGPGNVELQRELDGFAAMFDRQISLAVFSLGKATEAYEAVPSPTDAILMGDSAAILESSLPPEAVAAALKRFGASPLARGTWGDAFTEGAGAAQPIYESPRGSLPLYLASRGSAVLAATRRERLEKLLAAFDKPPANSLSANAGFKEAMADAAKENPMAFLYWNIEEGVRRLRTSLTEWERMHFDETVKAFPVKALWATWRGQGEKAWFRARVLTAKAQGGLLEALRAQPDSLDTAAVVPGGSLVYVSFSASVKDVCEYVLNLAMPRLPPGAAAGQPQQWAKFEATRKAVSLLAGRLGPETALYLNMPMGGGLIPNVAAVCQVKDAVAAGDDLRSLLEVAEMGKFKESAFLGCTIYSVAEQDTPFGLSYAILDRYLVLGITPQAVKEVISLQKKPSGSLQQNADFQASLKGLPEDRHGVAYVNTRGLALFVYNSIAPVLASPAMHREEEKEGAAFDPSLLPMPETIGRHLDKLVAVEQVDENGIRVEGYSDGLDPLTAMSLAALYAPIAGPLAVKETRKDLGYACFNVLYNVERPEGVETLPATQAEFLKKYLRDGLKELTCPLDRSPRDLGDGYKTSFRYFPEEFGVKMEFGRKSIQGWESRMSEIVLYEDVPRHERRVVLEASGFPRMMAEDEFQKQLKAQKEKYGVGQKKP
jgi:hypothetical protein